MSDIAIFLARASAAYQGTHEERALSALLFDDRVTVELGDQRLNSIAALTYNLTQCNNIFNLLLRSLDPHEFPWRTLHKAVLVYHTIVLFGSDIAVDKCIRSSRTIYLLQNYNSATQAKGLFFSSSGGTDYGAPVRAAAQVLVRILESDSTIRRARAEARQGQDSLVPMGSAPPPGAASAIDDDGDLLGLGVVKPPANLTFGQGVGKSIGAGFDLSAVPGMYEGRPERYFDNTNDPRRGGVTTGDHQFTREAMNPNSLLDLAFGDDGGSADNSHLPEAQYLPALEKQKELEALLRQQQEQLMRLQQMQQQQQVQPSYVGMPPPQSSASNDLLGFAMSMPAQPPSGPPPPVPPMPPMDFMGSGGVSAPGIAGGMGMPYGGGGSQPPMGGAAGVPSSMMGAAPSMPMPGGFGGQAMQPTAAAAPMGSMMGAGAVGGVGGGGAMMMGGGGMGAAPGNMAMMGPPGGMAGGGMGGMMMQPMMGGAMQYGQQQQQQPYMQQPQQQQFGGAGYPQQQQQSYNYGGQRPMGGW